MKKNQQIQHLYHQWKDETATELADMREFAKWMASKGYDMPEPKDPLDILAKRLSEAVREETRRDEETGLPYKVNLAFSPDNSGQRMLWADVDRAPRKIVHKCLVQRRDQMVGDAYQLTLIQDHWNRINPFEEPIKMELDFQPDVDWKKNGGDTQADVA